MGKEVSGAHRIAWRSNHFIELQRCKGLDTLFVQVHTASRGFGHGLATKTVGNIGGHRRLRKGPLE